MEEETSDEMPEHVRNLIEVAELVGMALVALYAAAVAGKAIADRFRRELPDVAD